MTSDRIKKLDDLGFVWDPRKAEQKPKALGSADTDDDDDDDDDENGYDYFDSADSFSSH
jgi:hypothetical protein